MLALISVLPAAARKDEAGAAQTELIPSVGHGNTVTALAYSPDGRYLASVGRDRAGRIWNGKSGVLLRTLTGVDSPLLAVTFSADSHMVFTAAQNGSVQWWNADTGKRLGLTDATGGGSTAIALRPVGPAGTELLLAIATKDRNISVTRYKSVGGLPERVVTLKGRPQEIGVLQISPNGKLLAGGGKDGLLKLWDLEDGLLQFDMKSHAMPVRGLAFSADGNTLADASEDGDTNRWDVRTGKQIGSRLQLNAPGDGVSAVAFGPDSRTMATGGWRSIENKQAYAVLWDAEAEKMKHALVGHGSAVTALAFSPNGRMLASGSMDHTVRIWNSETGKQIVTSGVRIGVTSVAICAKPPLLATGSTDSAVRIWSTETGELLRLLRGHLGTVSAVAITSDGAQLISGGGDGTIRWWNPVTGESQRAVESTNGPISALVLSSDGRMIATGHRTMTSNGAIELRDRATGDLIKTLDSHGLYPVTALAFSPDGATLASGGGKGSFFEQVSDVRLWSVMSGEQVAFKPSGNSGPVTSLAFSPNGRLLASARSKMAAQSDLRETFTGEIQIWNGQTLTPAATAELAAPESWPNALAFLTDNQTIVSGGEDGVLHHWNARTGESLGVYSSAHLGPINAFSLAAKGILLASGGADNTVRIWNTDTRSMYLTQTTLPATTAMADGADTAPSSDWLAATPFGYYDGSANAGRQIQWRVGPDLFPIDSFEAIRHKPNELWQALKLARLPNLETKSTPGALLFVGGPIRGKLRGKREDTSAPPQITFIEPAGGSRIEGDTLTIRGWATDAQAIESIVFQVNGRPAKAKSLMIAAKPLTIAAKPLTIAAKPLTIAAKPLPVLEEVPASHKFYQNFEAVLQLPATESELVVSAIAENANKLSSREELHLSRSRIAEKGILHVLTVGVSRYKNPAYNLKYARSDAEAFGAMWTRRGRSLYKEVRVTELLDDRATAANIRAALQKLVRQASSSDCVAIFLSGHGVQFGGSYYFASQDIEARGPRLAATALPWTVFQEALSDIKARRVILFLDSCHAGNALGKMQANSDRIAEELVKRAGVMVFASSRGSEYSYELENVMHGAFTQAILEGIGDNKANLEIAGQRADSISAEDLLAYLRRRVPQLTENRQTPSCPLIRDFGDVFPLVNVR